MRELSGMTDEQLLDMRLCQLPVRIEGTDLEHRVAQLYYELDERGLRFKPYIWLSQEWFTPDDVPGFAIPFYLAHPRLAKLERKQMLEVEGGTTRDCLRIMRHESGHAIDNAFYLHRRQRYREVFGSFTLRYPDWYKPKPLSRDYVRHLPGWYAEAHPAEDFAETFAVWTWSGSRWKSRYRGWPALRKLEYVDKLMSEIRGKSRANKSRDRVDDLPDIQMTLREHYLKKREHYTLRWPPNYDRDLLRIFSSEPVHNSRSSAAGFILRHRRTLCREVAEGTGVHQYTIDQMLSQMVNRCRELKLHVNPAPEHTRQKVLISLTVQTMNVILAGCRRIAL